MTYPGYKQADQMNFQATHSTVTFYQQSTHIPQRYVVTPPTAGHTYTQYFCMR